MRRHLITVVVLFGCGPSSGTQPDDDGSADATSSAASCEQYDANLVDGVTVEIRVRNAGTLPVYFASVGCGPEFGFDILPVGEDAPAPRGDLCTRTC